MGLRESSEDSGILGCRLAGFGLSTFEVRASSAPQIKSLVSLFLNCF